MYLAVPAQAHSSETNKQLYFNELVERSAFHARYDGVSNSQFVDSLIANTVQI